MEFLLEYALIHIAVQLDAFIRVFHTLVCARVFPTLNALNIIKNHRTHMYGHTSPKGGIFTALSPPNSYFIKSVTIFRLDPAREKVLLSSTRIQERKITTSKEWSGSRRAENRIQTLYTVATQGNTFPRAPIHDFHRVQGREIARSRSLAHRQLCCIPS